MTIIIELRELSKQFRLSSGEVPALNRVNLQVQAGEILGLLGPNGAGKTTAVKLVMGFLHPSAGVVAYKNRPLQSAEPRAHFGYLPESFQPNPNLTVSEYLRFQCRLAGFGSKTISRRIETVLHRVGMSAYASRRLSSLSKGMGQRVGLAQACIGDPEVLILDEPSSGLDPLGKGEVIRLLLELKTAGTTIFFCSHILSEVERLCDRIGILAGGGLRFAGSVEAFFTKWGTRDLEQAFRLEVQCEPSSSSGN